MRGLTSGALVAALGLALAGCGDQPKKAAPPGTKITTPTSAEIYVPGMT